MDDLLAEFVAETRDMLEAIGGEIVAWEADPADRARLDSVFRFVHTVKGNCGFFDFPRLQSLSHEAETALAEVRAETRQADAALVNGVLAIIDVIAELVELIDAGEDLPEDEAGDAALFAALEPGAAPVVPVEVAPEPDPEPVTDTEETETPQSPVNLAQPPRSIRLTVDLLDRVMSGVSDMVLARNDLSRRLREAGADPALDGPFERLSRILADTREAVTKMRMGRVDVLFTPLPRLVRDVAAECGKQVHVEMDAGDVELDREMIESIRDPIVHLIRNAVDHGIETAEERVAAGKPAAGMVRIAARQSGNLITLSISDDGGGLDTARIADKAVAAGVIDAATRATLSDEACADLIFTPGLSTATQVSAISGRGVGMDVVRANLARVGGTVAVRSTPGSGTHFELVIPLTLSIIPALTVALGDQRFAIPQSYIEEIAHNGGRPIAFSQIGTSRMMTFRDKRIKCLSLGTVLDLDHAQGEPKQKVILLRLGGGGIFALAVDAIFDQEDLVIKPLAPAVAQSGVYAGSTLLDDGQPVLMLDVPAIAQAHGLSETAWRPVDIADAAPEDSMPPRELMTFTGFDGHRYAVGMELVMRVDEVAPGAVHRLGDRASVVIDDRLCGLYGLAGVAETPDNLRILRLSDGEIEIAYAVELLGDAIASSADMRAAPDESAIEGTVLHDGQPIRILDGLALFAQQDAVAPVRAAPISRPACRLPEGVAWADRLLEPLVRAAGYRIVSNATEADVVFTTDAAGTQATNTIRLYTDADEAARRGDGLYRYDRDGLLAALKRARQERAA
ncbi:MAG: chemotaxis protein CheA [Parerythrobacter sp.]